MNRIHKLIVISLTSLLIMGFTNFMLRANVPSVSVIEPQPIQTIQYKITIPTAEINELDLFLSVIGHRESSNRYDVVNRFGYMGKYQFGKGTLKDIGIDVSRKEFINSPTLQERAMILLLKRNKRLLQKYIVEWDGKTVNGMYISESGILAAAHLGGAGSVKRYFKHGKVFKDGNGTKITSYLDQFSGYNLNLK